MQGLVKSTLCLPLNEEMSLRQSSEMYFRRQVNIIEFSGYKVNTKSKLTIHVPDLVVNHQCSPEKSTLEDTFKNSTYH